MRIISDPLYEGSQGKGRSCSAGVREGLQSADRILLDTYVANVPGGTGKTMDWTQAARVVDGLDKPVVLAGGLDGRNVGEAIRIASPAGVDVSSGVEESPGIKSVSKIKYFFNGGKSCLKPQLKLR